MPTMPPDAFVDMTPKLRAVRDKISAGAAQLKGIESRPLVVVLANPRNSWVPIEGAMFLGALFGDPGAYLTPDGGMAMGSGRNGRLQVRELDGSIHGNHPYLSAVAVLRFVYPKTAWATAMAQSEAMGNTNPSAIVRVATQLLAQQGESAAEAICLDVFECVSDSAVPLFRDVFAGPYDTRWGVTGVGQYWQVAGPVG
jgi:hypothetical protein